ncbi:MAG: HAMP domain-containing sensor histidine kinase [Ahrensia sp.]|nr:HAMP domain-containing sensor histidine kinase [Ahrensia sp.]
MQRSPIRKRKRTLPRSLSAKLLLLTIVVVMATEVFIFMPSVANYRLTWLARHFNTGEAASLSLEKLDPELVPPDMPQQLLSLTQTQAIIVRRDGASRILATSAMPEEIEDHVMLEAPGRAAAVRSMVDALDTLINGGDRIIRVYGPMQERPGELELVMKDEPLRAAMLSYAGNVLLISLALSFFTGLVVFLVLRWFLIRPLQRMSDAMLAFARDPEDASNVIEPSGRDDEIGVTEEQLSKMQVQLRGTFTQQKALANLGLAVSKINHDMRNILASASLFSDRLSSAEDPLVKRLAPRLVRSIDRAADYTKQVLDYGKAGEAVPRKVLLRPHRLCRDVGETLALDGEGDDAIEWVNAVPPDLEINADPDQLFRVLLNLCRNAIKAMEGMDAASVRRLMVMANRDGDTVLIEVSDTGPGIPEDIAEHLFTAFKTSDRKGGTGLGLAIAAELVRVHDGSIDLLRDGQPGTTFCIRLPAT